ncbi:Arc family DNA-binding protein [Rhizobium altiplani]|uniref:Arc family DNA-binding protein n=1 Tax=Rhizobium altiplani TaxID=1864509 RepID=UPI00078366CB
MAHSHHFCSIFTIRNFLHKALMPQSEDPRHNLRLTTELYKKLAHSRVDSGRSMNSEIVSRLEASFAPTPMLEIENLLRSVLSLSDTERRDALLLLSKLTAILGER